jgi:putative SOS response-associated peptidase YedK
MSFLYRRCLIPAYSFVEWNRVSAKVRLPSLFAMRAGEPFGIAGSWQHWHSPDRKTELDTFAVVTDEPNEIVHDLTEHGRIPLLIKRTDYERWLRVEDVEQPPVDPLRPFDSDKMKAWQVSTRINSRRNNDPSRIEPVEDGEAAPGGETDSAQMEMFGGS